MQAPHPLSHEGGEWVWRFGPPPNADACRVGAPRRETERERDSTSEKDPTLASLMPWIPWREKIISNLFGLTPLSLCLYYNHLEGGRWGSRLLPNYAGLSNLLFSPPWLPPPVRQGGGARRHRRGDGGGDLEFGMRDREGMCNEDWISLPPARSIGGGDTLDYRGGGGRGPCTLWREATEKLETVGGSRQRENSSFI